MLKSEMLPNIVFSKGTIIDTDAEGSGLSIGQAETFISFGVAEYVIEKAVKQPSGAKKGKK